MPAYMKNGDSIGPSILSGDILLVKIYQFFEEFDAEVFHKVTLEFSDMFIKVCESQQMNINFEQTQIPRFDQLHTDDHL